MSGINNSFKYINVSAYLFCELDINTLPALKQRLLARALELDLKGTVLLSEEGINIFVSGVREAIDSYQQFLLAHSEFTELSFKESPSSHQPFSRMLVRIKKEIISMGRDEIKPGQKTAPYVSAEQLKEWYEQGKDMVVLDTRNDYEIKLGTFDNAVDLNITSFRSFPEAVKKLPDDMKDKTVVTFCTGGIRCEKAAEYMEREGFNDVYQLEGGILKYFELCGSDYYTGDCFVFDKRVAVDSNLHETSTAQCYACRTPLLPEEFTVGAPCPCCGGNIEAGKRALTTSVV